MGERTEEDEKSTFSSARRLALCTDALLRSIAFLSAPTSMALVLGAVEGLEVAMEEALAAMGEVLVAAMETVAVVVEAAATAWRGAQHGRGEKAATGRYFEI
jgi:hypothetical protein